MVGRVQRGYSDRAHPIEMEDTILIPKNQQDFNYLNSPLAQLVGRTC
jgi:hypothetical protein